MCTIIKVKRKITEDPVECLIIECKKKKLFNSNDSTFVAADSAESSGKISSELIKQVLKYVGSADDETEIPAKLKELNEKLSDNTTKSEEKVTNNISKSDRSVRAASKRAKVDKAHKQISYVMIGKKRGLETDGDEPQEGDEVSQTPSSDASQQSNDKKFKQVTTSHLDNVNIIDVISASYFDSIESEPPSMIEKNGNESKRSTTKKGEEKITCNGVELIREKLDNVNGEKARDYVYDIYYTQNEDVNFNFLNSNNFEIKSYNIYKESEIVDANSEDESDEIYEDDDDSNNETNWRNDYPEDEEDDIDDEDDDEPKYFKGAKNRSYYEDDDYADNYNEYGNDYNNDEDDLHSKKLSTYMKKSLNLDRSNNEEESDNDDYDEYNQDEIEKSYNVYKKKILKEFKKEGNKENI